MFVSPAHPQCSETAYVCECGVTECLNYGLIVSLAGFCCWHHIGPVKVNYWNMFICCQPLPQAVTCMETQTNTRRSCSLKQFTGHLVSLNVFLSSFVSASTHFVQHSTSQPVMQTLQDPAVSLHPKGIKSRQWWKLKAV